MTTRKLYTRQPFDAFKDSDELDNGNRLYHGVQNVYDQDSDRHLGSIALSVEVDEHSKFVALHLTEHAQTDMGLAPVERSYRGAVGLALWRLFRSAGRFMPASVTSHLGNAESAGDDATVIYTTFEEVFNNE